MADFKEGAERVQGSFSSFQGHPFSSSYENITTTDPCTLLYQYAGTRSVAPCPNVYITGNPTLFPFPSNLIHPSLHRCGSTKCPISPPLELRILLNIDLLSCLSNLYESLTASLKGKMSPIYYTVMKRRRPSSWVWQGREWRMRGRCVRFEVVLHAYRHLGWDRNGILRSASQPASHPPTAPSPAHPLTG